jgi:hypothetical protein
MGVSMDKPGDMTMLVKAVADLVQGRASRKHVTDAIADMAPDAQHA